MNQTTVSFKNYTIRQKVAEYTLIFLISLGFMLVFSLWTSPFYKNWYGCDASFFTMVGRCITEGKVMYRDFYDLKGPYFFFIEALTQIIIKGRTGAFIAQVVSLFLSSVLIWQIALMFINKAKASFILLVFYFCHICTLWGGNTLEEYFLPISLFSLYMVLRIYIDEESGSVKKGTSLPDFPFYIPLLLGLFLGVIIFAKISVCGTVLGIIAAISYMLIANKRYKDLFVFIIYVLLGVMLASLPMIVYFACKDCLFDMLKCVFITGFRRSKDWGELFNLTWELKCMGAVFSLVFAITHRRRSRNNLCIILIAMSSATYILLHLGTPFHYYFTSVYPCLVLALALFFEAYDPVILFESSKQCICLCLFAAFLFYYIPASLGNIRTALYDRYDTQYQEYVNDSLDLASFIPDFERDNVFSFLIDMQWYEINDITPCNKYVVNLPFFCVLDPDIIPELTDYLTYTPPKWLIIGNDFESSLPEFSQIVNSSYSNIYENNVGRLYLLNE